MLFIPLFGHCKSYNACRTESCLRLRANSRWLLRSWPRFVLMSILSLAFMLFAIQDPFTPSYTSETFSRPWRSTRAIHVNSFRNLSTRRNNLVGQPLYPPGTRAVARLEV